MSIAANRYDETLSASVEADARELCARRAPRHWAVAVGLDAAMLVAAAVAATLGSGAADVTPLPAVLTAAFCGTVLVSFALRGLYRPPVRVRPLRELRDVALGLGLCALLAIVVRA